MNENNLFGWLLDSLPGPDLDAQRKVADRAGQVLRPLGALARLDQIAVWLAGWQRTDHPRVEHPVVVVFAADHGVTEEGVSAYPVETTATMVRVFRHGLGTVNVLAAEVGAKVGVVDVGVGVPTANLAVEDALSPQRFAACVAAGQKAVADANNPDLLVVGEMGIGNTTAAAAVAAALFGGPVEGWVGRGTGIDDDALSRKTQAVRRALARIGAISDPFEALRRVGGAELAAAAGALVEARIRSIPVLLDGFVVTAAAAPLELAKAGSLAHCLAGHRSAEPGHDLLLAELGLEPLLDLDLRLGEGSGAVAAIPLVRMAVRAVTDVPTFAEWDLAAR